MRLFCLFILLIFNNKCSGRKYKDVPCEWPSHSGTFYDLKPLTIPDHKPDYYIKDGDIPCTPEHEPTYSFSWNLCSKVSTDNLPSICTKQKKEGAAIQYVVRDDNYEECEVIGRYDSSHDDLGYSLLNEQNPAEGVSITYGLGDMCKKEQVQRSATIDVQCYNVDEPLIVSALEPSKCQYHIVMKSKHGCPTSCPITDNGLCNSHGYCNWDKKNKKAYCFCNEGYGGDSCIEGADGSESYDGYSVQMGLLVTLLLVSLALIGVVGFLIYRIMTFRQKDSLGLGSTSYNPLSSFSSGDDNIDYNQSPSQEMSNFERFGEESF